MGEAVSAGNQVAGDNDQVRLELIDPLDVLNEVARPDDRAVVQVGHLHDLETRERRVEPSDGHAPAVNVDPPPVHRQRVHAGQPHPREHPPDGLAPADLVSPPRCPEIIANGIEHESQNTAHDHSIIESAASISSAAWLSPFCRATTIPWRYVRLAASRSPPSS